MKIDDHEIEALRRLPPERLMRASEVAALLRVTTQTLYIWRKNGNPPPFIPSNRPPKNRNHSTAPVHYKRGDLDPYFKTSDQSKTIHAFTVNEAGQIASHPHVIDWDEVVVGPINDLLREEQWADETLLREAIATAQRETEIIGEEALARFEKSVLDQALGLD